MIETVKYVRKPSYYDAIQVTVENIHEVAQWANGYIQFDPRKQKYIKVKVYLPINSRQTKAFVGDWVLRSDTGFKVFTQKAFEGNFALCESVETAKFQIVNS